jgi:hypothetical protein
MAHSQPRALPGGANWAGGYTSPEEVAKKVLADREAINARTKLTWNPDRPPLAPIDRVVGEVVLVDKENNRYEVRGVNMSLPYMRVGTDVKGRYYYIQNARVFTSNGTETELETIQRTENPEIFDFIKQAYDVFIKDAAKRDDALCKICVKYRSRNHEDYLRHMVSEHPDHVSKYLGGPEPAPVSVPAVAFQTPAQDGLSCCGKTFKDKRGLVGHTRFKHQRA